MDDREILSARILIVDDQRLHIRLLEGILTSAGYTALQSLTDSRQAVCVCQDWMPDLIFLDLKMPHVDGFQVMEQLRDLRQREYIPILVCTAITDQESRLRALKAGATDFINIPYDSLEVLIRIKTMIEARLLHQQIKNQKEILESKIQERTKELRDTQLDIIRRLAHAAEYRDNETGIHIIRMSHYCAKLGEAIGLNESDRELLLNASPLHDIGKIGIPDHILLKPGKLTDEEYEIMKTHTTIGSELLSGSDSPLMKMAQTIALTHQEKWDGTGYPKGLKGEEIPLVGRLVGLCDVFDALTSNRPYKKAWSTQDAVEEIRNQKGKQFDPKLVEAFMKILPEIKAIQKKYLEE
ncbi:MAG: HD domain-containing phosphohydrolase [Candidatus Omnitrophota bacterium]